MKRPAPPTSRNSFHADHVELLRASLRHWTGRDLLPGALRGAEAARALYKAAFAVVSHGTETDPVFNYANRAALALFEMDWETFTSLPSRYSAEPLEQAERDRLLARVTANGFIDSYEGVRIASSGRRFRISGATVWNLLSPSGAPAGQAAAFDQWTFA